ncbi:DUF4145 domain-containing protein [Cupriavidus necator]|uniref:DUF4145 domain-containing protein n=1 Tax=Cupriavidus necator TaxID=106590 RepID=UPI0014901F87|nr:DUF4145 domain-containing protein [Cupriavidus necator]NOV23403.1 DUF4145 domain-containing protein [Cupriavidus necator]
MSDTATREFTVQQNQGLTLQVLCIDCRRETEHKVAAPSFRESGSHGEASWSVEWQENYQILQCGGCKAVTFRHHHWFSEDADPDDLGNETLYPARDGRPVRRFEHVPTTLTKLYAKVVARLNNDSHILCAAGLRALVEGLCVDRGVKDGLVPQANGSPKRTGNLEGKIYGLHEQGVVTADSADFLHSHRFLGNEAVHELTGAPQEELGLALDIVEHMLEQVYEIPAKAASLKQARATRKQKSP